MARIALATVVAVTVGWVTGPDPGLVRPRVGSGAVLVGWHGTRAHVGIVVPPPDELFHDPPPPPPPEPAPPPDPVPIPDPPPAIGAKDADQPPAPKPAAVWPSSGVGDCTGFVIPDWIIQRESGGNPWIWNTSGSGAFGCAQTLIGHYNPGGACAGDDPMTLDGQRDCVYRLSNGGTNLRPWGF